MAHDLNNLIEKIRQEGIQAAHESARLIDEEARGRAEATIVNARREAEALILAARREADMLRESGLQAMRQAARDTILTLRESLLAALKNVSAAQTRQALGPQELAGIIHDVIMNSQSGSVCAVVELRPDDVERVRCALLPRLSDELRKGITLKASSTVTGGFTISFDAGKSCFDFSDAALAEYFCSALRPAIAGAIKT